MNNSGGGRLVNFSIVFVSIFSYRSGTHVREPFHDLEGERLSPTF